MRTDAAGARALVADGVGSALALTTLQARPNAIYAPFGSTAATNTSDVTQRNMDGNEGNGLYFYRPAFRTGDGQVHTEDPAGSPPGRTSIRM